MDKKEADFNPTKELVIGILTRDINMQDCILDLIDNSVDSYTRNNIKDRRTIKISIKKDHFEICDTCGGIPSELIEHEIFRSGNKILSQKYQTIGMYGIGLKRAIFKMGNCILFESDDGNDYSKLEMNVKKWLEQPNNWKWPLEVYKSGHIAGKANYTRIYITELKDEVKEIFNLESFINNLRKRIGIYYTKFIDKSIDFFINGIKEEQFELSISIVDKHDASQEYYEYDGVKIRILCWVQARDSKRSQREITQRGWNIFMNDRLIMLDDTTELTGWTGERGRLPRFHNIYNDFRGLVFITSKDSSRLPINTAKNGFNEENKTYQYLLGKMIVTAKPVIDYLSNKYSKLKDDINEKEHVINSTIQKEKSQKTQLISVDKFNLTSVFKKSIPTVRESPLTSIQYQKPKQDVDSVKKHLRVTTNQDVGIKTFDYYVKAEGLKND